MAIILVNLQCQNDEKQKLLRAELSKSTFESIKIINRK